jgi:hypothetical protein
MVEVQSGASLPFASNTAPFESDGTITLEAERFASAGDSHQQRQRRYAGERYRIGNESPLNVR